MSFPCPVDGCPYVGGTEKARASHIQKRHPEELRPLPIAPVYTPIVAPKRAAIYLRVSTIDQHPENQLPEVRRFCALKGYAVEGTWDMATDECTGNVYVDKASGKNADRPQMKRLLSDSVASSGPAFDVVVFRRLSRWGRSLRDNIALFDHFQAVGIALVSVEEPYDTTTPAGRLIRNVLSSVHEYERENLLAQVYEGIARRRAEGKPMGRHPAGCGIPRELGGLGPCPDGVQHKGFDPATLTEKAEKRRRDAQRKRLSRARLAAARDNPLARTGVPSPVDNRAAHGG